MKVSIITIYIYNKISQLFRQFFLYLLVDLAPAHSPFTERPGYQLDEPCDSPEQCFSLFFTSELWDFLVENTNEYALQKLNGRQVSHSNIITYFL